MATADECHSKNSSSGVLTCGHACLLTFSAQVLCARWPDSPHLIAALLPVLSAIKRMGSSGLGDHSGGEASALLRRLEVGVVGNYHHRRKSNSPLDDVCFAGIFQHAHLCCVPISICVGFLFSCTLGSMTVAMPSANSSRKKLTILRTPMESELMPPAHVGATVPVFIMEASKIWEICVSNILVEKLDYDMNAVHHVLQTPTVPYSATLPCPSAQIQCTYWIPRRHTLCHRTQQAERHFQPH